VTDTLLNPVAADIIYVGQDNGSTGRIAAIDYNGLVKHFWEVPTNETLALTKKMGKVTRVDWQKLRDMYEALKLLSPFLRIFVERPCTGVNVKVTMLAMRSFEATLIALELAGLRPHRIIDSGEWQSKMLPIGVPPGETKFASREVGCRLFPNHAAMITRTKTTDADALLMAECARREKW
jgi:hypothetical protein